MTVKELIEKLMDCDLDAEIGVLVTREEPTVREWLEDPQIVERENGEIALCANMGWYTTAARDATWIRP